MARVLLPCASCVKNLLGSTEGDAHDVRDGHASLAAVSLFALCLERARACSVFTPSGNFATMPRTWGQALALGALGSVGVGAAFAVWRIKARNNALEAERAVGAQYSEGGRRADAHRRRRPQRALCSAPTRARAYPSSLCFQQVTSKRARPRREWTCWV